MNLESFQNRILPAKNKLFRFALKFLGNEEEAKDANGNPVYKNHLIQVKGNVKAGAQ